jgi:exonuclease III
MQREVRSKIDESDCDVICLQETKCENFDWHLIRKFCPKRFDNFVFAPSVRASWGIMILWNSSMFQGTVIEIKRFGIVISFTSNHNNAVWTLVCIYGPCQGVERDNFVSWLYNLQIKPSENWLLLGDFNFIRSQDNRNRPGGDVNDMLIFNDIIGHLGLLELPLKGRAYTWSNMQTCPLLEQLDWFFTSANWISDYPNSIVLPLAKKGSDHVPCVVMINTNIPKARIFIFENYWVDLPGFIDCVSESWNKGSRKSYSSAIIADKFKSLWHALKLWHTSLGNLKALI